jgi:preprotein translocase subunit SecG
MQGMPSWMKWAIALLIGFAIIVAGWRLSDSRFFFWLLPAFFIMNCFVLIIVVLLQSGKAADLAGAFGGAGSQTAFGPRGAATLLSQATTWCAIMFMVCAFALVLRTDKAVEQGGSILQKFSKPASKPTPVTPAKPQSAAPQSTAPQSTVPQSNSAPATQTPAQPAPASTPPATAPTKKP